MIRVKNYSIYDEDSIDCSLFADTKAEVATTPVSEIEGFPRGYDIAFGSSCMTASGEVGFMKSDGSWKWIS